MTSPVPIGPTLVVVGAGLTLAGNLASEYHSRRFDAHTEELRRLSEEDDAEGVAAEVRAFGDDKRTDMAIHLVTAEPVGWILLLMGAAYLFL